MRKIAVVLLLFSQIARGQVIHEVQAWGVLSGSTLRSYPLFAYQDIQCLAENPIWEGCFNLCDHRIRQRHVLYPDYSAFTSPKTNQKREIYHGKNFSAKTKPLFSKFLSASSAKTSSFIRRLNMLTRQGVNQFEDLEPLGQKKPSMELTCWEVVKMRSSKQPGYISSI